MDFTVDRDKFSYIKNNLESISNTLTQYKNDYDSIINELSPGWKGRTKEKYLGVSGAWKAELEYLIEDIDKLKEIVNGLGLDSGDLLERGKKLKI